MLNKFSLTVLWKWFKLKLAVNLWTPFLLVGRIEQICFRKRQNGSRTYHWSPVSQFKNKTVSELLFHVQWFVDYGPPLLSAVVERLSKKRGKVFYIQLFKFHSLNVVVHFCFLLACLRRSNGQFCAKIKLNEFWATAHFLCSYCIIQSWFVLSLPQTWLSLICH